VGVEEAEAAGEVSENGRLQAVEHEHGRHLRMRP
jgi:hypothetical protein